MSLLHLRVANRGVDSAFPHEEVDDIRAMGDPDDQVIFRDRLGKREGRRYRLEWQEATEGQAWEVRNLFQQAGTTQSMNYIPPDRTAIVEVVFVSNSLEIRQMSVNHWEISFEVREVIR